MDNQGISMIETGVLVPFCQEIVDVNQQLLSTHNWLDIKSRWRDLLQHTIFQKINV